MCHQAGISTLGLPDLPAPLPARDLAVLEARLERCFAQLRLTVKSPSKPSAHPKFSISPDLIVFQFKLPQMRTTPYTESSVSLS